jgi:hypothetical protein
MKKERNKQEQAKMGTTKVIFLQGVKKNWAEGSAVSGAQTEGCLALVPRANKKKVVELSTYGVLVWTDERVEESSRVAVAVV